MKKSGLVVVVIGVATALILTGCTAAVGGSTSAGSSVAATGAAADCVSAVSADVTAAKKPIPLLVPAAALNVSSAKSKSIWLISATMNQAATEAADGFKAGATALGLTPVVFDGQGTANKFSEGVDQAVAQGAGGIVLYGIDPSLVSSSLAAAKAANIPVLNTLNGAPTDPVPAGTYANLTLNPQADGELAVKWALADSGCNTNMIMLTLPTIPLEKAFADGATAAMTKYCPACTLKTLNIDVANFTTDIGSQLQTALQQDPDANYIFPTFDSGVPFVAPVVSAANSKAKIMGHDGVQASLDMIAKGSGQNMTVAVPPLGWMGWLFVDDVARAMVGDKDPGYIIPSQLVDETNIGDGSSASVFPEYAGYEAAFTKAWAGK
ncbi:MAG: Sugar transporter substrate-binding protein [Subtercola sp.]|nr:Sugar transporter substrate-binding protein [Subtercola sp.]